MFDHLKPLLDSVAGLDGAFAEVGVRHGDTFEPLCRHAHARGAACYGIDSFEGMATPTERDVLADGGCRWVAGELDTGGEAGERAVRERVYDLGDTPQILRGWVPDVFQRISASARFAFVHLDLDQYEPTLAAAWHFWPRMVRGGIVVCHDYWPGCDRQASGGFSDFAAAWHQPIHELRESQHGWAVKP